MEKISFSRKPLSAAISVRPVLRSSAAFCGAVFLATSVLPVTADAATHSKAANVQQHSQISLTFIDGGLDDASVLAQEAQGSVFYLDAGRDGISQITEVLARHKNVGSVHILSHGGPGYLALGSSILNKENLAYYQNDMQQWRDALAQGADLHLYGCNAAAGDKGANFIAALADKTGADIAASDDLTGSHKKGGDWDLEVKVGGVTTASIDTQRYLHTLADGEFIVGDGSGGGGGGAGYYYYASPGNGGNGGADDDTLLGTSGDDVIFGDGSGGGGGGDSYYGPGAGGVGGGGNDIILGKAGNDILFGDGFDGQDGGNVDSAIGGAGGLGGGGGGGGSNYYYGRDQTTGGKGGIGAGGGGGGDYNYGGDGGIGGGGGGGGGTTDFDKGGLGGGLGATDGTGESGDAGGGGGGGGFFGVGGTGALYSGLPGGTGGNGGSSSTGTGNGGNGCDGNLSNDTYDENAGDYSGGAGGGGFGNANGGDSGCDDDTPQEDWDGDNGQDGDTQTYRMTDTGGVVYSFVSGQLETILSDSAGEGAGQDILNGGPGSDHLFGLGGNDSFVFVMEDGDSGADTDTVWDFSDGDALVLLRSGSNLGATAINDLLAAQATDGDDRSIVLEEGGNSTTIIVKNVARDLAIGDFDTESTAADFAVSSGSSAAAAVRRSSSGGSLSWPWLSLLGLAALRNRKRKS